MKIGYNLLFLIPGKVGGTETYSRGILEAINKIDEKNTHILFCNKENYDSFNFKNNLFRKILCPINANFRPFRIAYEQLIFPLALLVNKVDVVFSLGYIAPLFTPCRSYVIIYDLNWFFHPEEFSFFQKFFWKTLVTWSARRADGIITSSQNSKNALHKILKIKKEKIVVVHGGIDTEKFKRASLSRINEVKKKYSIKKNFIFTASAAYEFKNLERLIDAFKDVSSNFPDISLLIVGLKGKASPKIKEKIKKYDLTKKVIVAGWVPDEDIPALYSAAELYVHPSLYEGFGFPVLEAMACGCPVVSSNSASLPELVGDAGLLVDARQVSKLAQGMKNVLGKTTVSSGLRRKGDVRWRAFTWERAAKMFLGLTK